MQASARVSLSTKVRPVFSKLAAYSTLLDFLVFSSLYTARFFGSYLIAVQIELKTSGIF